MMRGDTDQTYAVLFVDDEEKAQKYIRMTYAKDFPVVTAGSVPEALDILGSQGDEIGVLITDQRMPGQQGVDLLKRARDEWPQIVRILTTAYSDLDDAIAAVNRGEILRYVTKPWDIQSLRVDLRHAMEFFLLRRERDLLMAEKFSVRQRMVQSDRLRGLLTIAAGLARLHHSPHAVAAWVRDVLANASEAQPRPADLELWGLEVRETLDLMAANCSLRALDDMVEAGYPDRVALDGLLRGVGIALEGQAPEIAARLDLLEPMISTLAHLAQHPSVVHLEQNAGGEGVTLRLTGSSPVSTLFTGDLGLGGADMGLLKAYVIAWHHGGTLRTATEGEVSQFELTLPVDPSAVALPEPNADWLAGQFSMLEDW